MPGYITFYKGQRLEVHAATKLQAQELAARSFKAKRAWEVAVELAETDAGEAIVQEPLQ